MAGNVVVFLVVLVGMPMVSVVVRGVVLVLVGGYTSNPPPPHTHTHTHTSLTHYGTTIPNISHMYLLQSHNVLDHPGKATLQ